MRDIYIASRVKDGGVYHCRLSEAGQLRIVKQYAVESPAYLCREGDTLYAMLREPFLLESGLVSFRIREDGALEQLTGPESLHGTITAHIFARDGIVWSANYINGTVTRMPDRIIAFNGHGARPGAQDSSHPHCITPTPDGKYLCVTDLGTDRVYIITPELERISETKLPDGCGPRHLIFSPDGRFGYCSTEFGSTVCVLAYSDGVLRLLCEYPTVPADFAGESTAAAIRLSEDGKRLYVSNRGHDSVCVFDADGCKLRCVGYIPSFGHFPREMNLAGDFLLCGNELSDTVTVFSLKDGLPQAPVCSLDIAMPWGILVR